MSGKPRTSEVEVGGKKDISGIPSYGTIAIGQADRPTDTQSQTGRQTTREGQSTKCTGRQDGTQGDTFLFKGPARALSPGMRTTHSHPLPKNLVSLWGSLLVVPGNEEERERERERTQTKREMGGWMDGLAVLSIRAPKESTRQTFFASTLPDCTQGY